MGDDAPVDRFVAALGPERELRVGAAGPVADGLATLSAGAGVVGGGGRYVEVSARHGEMLKRQGAPDGTGAFLPTLEGPCGKFTENISLEPVGALKAAAGLQSVLAFGALRLAIEEMQEAVEAVAKDDADLRRTRTSRSVVASVMLRDTPCPLSRPLIHADTRRTG